MFKREKKSRETELGDKGNETREKGGKLRKVCTDIEDPYHISEHNKAKLPRMKSKKSSSKIMELRDSQSMFCINLQIASFQLALAHALKF